MTTTELHVKATSPINYTAHDLNSGKVSIIGSGSTQIIVSNRDYKIVSTGTVYRQSLSVVELM